MQRTFPKTSFMTWEDTIVAHMVDGIDVFVKLPQGWPLTWYLSRAQVSIILFTRDIFDAPLQGWIKLLIRSTIIYYSNCLTCVAHFLTLCRRPIGIELLIKYRCKIYIMNDNSTWTCMVYICLKECKTWLKFLNMLSN